ncbi:MAG: NDP-sugar synthase [Armatimonadetes bacterium]|nr:NDP-sugar synthase [Armatimonadota bacterium]MDE2206097.1 NDP-sugar synthase [Armatimonadota bacterium]
MILAAGVGARLHPLTSQLPKPMVPVANRPVMAYLLELLAAHGFKELWVNLHYLGDKIEQHFGDGSAFGVSIHWQPEERLYGDAGSLKRAAGFFQEGPVLVIGGDDLTDLDLTAFLAHHRDNRADATIALSPVEETSQYGVAVLDERGVVVGFQEKVPLSEAKSKLANTGIYLFNRELLDLIPAEGAPLLGRFLLPEILRLGKKLCGYPTSAYWRDVGDLEVYRQSQSDLLRGRMQCRLPVAESSAGVCIASTAQVAAGARIKAPVLIGEECVVAEGACIGPDTVLGDGCRIDAGARVASTVLWSGVRVAEGVQLESCAVGSGATVAQSHEGQILAGG